VQADVRARQFAEAERKEYVRRAETIVEALDKLSAMEARNLLSGGKVHSFLPDELLTFVREQITPRLPTLREALDHLDPDGKVLRDVISGMHHPAGLGGSVRHTFEQGLQEVYSLIERNPDMDLDEHYFPDTAYDVFDSKLIAFDPDAWLNRAGELSPVRTNNRNLALPSHVRLRLEELYRNYVFGCWLSVLSLSRSILEYTLLDNAGRLSIETQWPADAKGARREKKLSHLIDDYAALLPTVAPELTELRELGNEYVHPKRSQISKERLLYRQQEAKRAIGLVVEAVEAVYLARRA